jgi:hypothetical protein
MQMAATRNMPSQFDTLARRVSYTRTLPNGKRGIGPGWSRVLNRLRGLSDLGQPLESWDRPYARPVSKLPKPFASANAVLDALYRVAA